MQSLKLYNGDCLECMKAIPPQSIDMILCDLPYGVTQNKNDAPIPLEPLWKQYRRIIKDNGVIALFGQGIFFADLIHSNRSWFRYDLIWDKQLTSGFLNANKMPLRKHEQIAIFYKKLPKYNPQYISGKPLHSKGKKYREKENINNNYGQYHNIVDNRAGSTQKHPVSILSFQKPHPSKALHRTEKPVALCEWLIKSYTDVGDVVLDNCMGCGTTGIAALNTGRNFVGIEMDKHYFELSKSRLLKHKEVIQKNE